jgi:lipase
VALHVHEWGPADAPAVVCLHGVRSHGLLFRKLAEERLAPRHRVLAPDLRGHGRSDWEPPWSFETHLDDLRETLDRTGVGEAVYVGHSFGGRLVLELAAREPERVERAVLLDPAIWVPPPVALEGAEAERLDRSFASAEEALEQRVVTSRLHHTPRELLEEEMREHLRLCDDGRYRYRYCQSAVVTAYAEMAHAPPPFERLRVPTLLVHGALSDVMPDVLVEVVREGLDELVQIVTVAGGHHVLWDAFAETATAIEPFLP